MTTLQILRKSSRFGQLELGLNSIASPTSKESATTGYSSGDSFDDNPIDAVAQSRDRDFISSHQCSFDELKIKLLKLRQQKSSMDLKFKNQIMVLQSDVAAMEQQNRFLKKICTEVKHNVQQIKCDLNVLKACLSNRQPNSCLQPETSLFQKQQKVSSRLNPRSKPSKMFKACSGKGK